MPQEVEQLKKPCEEVEVRAHERTLSSVVEECEGNYVREILRHCKGNVSHAAKNAGVALRTLWNKMDKYGIDRAAYEGQNFYQIIG